MEIAVTNPQGRLLPGMVARVTFEPAVPQKIILIPRKAVRMINGSEVVYILDSGQAVRRVVETGTVMGTDIVIEKGLSPGDRLIVSEIKSSHTGQSE